MPCPTLGSSCFCESDGWLDGLDDGWMYWMNGCDGWMELKSDDVSEEQHEMTMIINWGSQMFPDSIAFLLSSFQWMSASDRNSTCKC